MGEPTFGVAYRFSTSLPSSSGGGFQVDPTIAPGDFQVSTEGGAFANLATLPIVDPAKSDTVLIGLSAAEMSSDRIVVSGVDVIGGEWDDVMIFIDTPDILAADEVFDSLFSDATTEVQPDGSRILTIFEDDGFTVKARVRVSADGTTRTKL